MTSDRENARSPDHLRFALLPPDERLTTVRRLIAFGWRDQAIMNLTGITLEQVQAFRAQSQVLA